MEMRIRIDDNDPAVDTKHYEDEIQSIDDGYLLISSATTGRWLAKEKAGHRKVWRVISVNKMWMIDVYGTNLNFRELRIQTSLCHALCN